MPKATGITSSSAISPYLEMNSPTSSLGLRTGFLVGTEVASTV